jgi:hypothetical protein
MWTAEHYVPFDAAASALLCLHWDRSGGRGGIQVTTVVAARRCRLPVRYLAGIGVGIAGLVVLPYAEELLRCARRAR